MTHTKCLIAVLLGTLVYTLLSLIAGRDGIWAYRQLAEQKREISTHAAAIQKINDELSLEQTALEKDRDVIAAYARKLDYVNPDEKLVKITGLRPCQTALYDTGTVMRRRTMTYMSESVCKAVGVIFFALSLLLMYMAGYDKNRNTHIHTAKRNKTDFIKGVPVYDVPQI
jgi:cell division protein FtsB